MNGDYSASRDKLHFGRFSSFTHFEVGNYY